MDNTTINNILNFLATNEGKKLPGTWIQFKLENNIPLPEGLKVGGNLRLNHTKIKSLPKGLKVDGDLTLSFSKITSLPEGLKVGGDLDLYWTDITLLPKGLKVGGDLNIRATELTRYPDEELMKMIEPGFITGSIIR